ncbi:MAG: MFS transporter [Alphaproteobacteria bacterium]|nr:MAG: MFS transporter [Alphaproteobacteria bacterium]
MGAVDSTYAWMRLVVALVLGTIGSVGMWSYVVALPPVQADFGVLRNLASLPYTMAMIGFAFGGVAMGRLADRYGVVVPAIGGTLLTAIGFFAAGLAPNIWILSAAHVVIGFGCSGTFGPIVSDMSHWFRKRRGIAIGIASCGNYAAGAIWPPIVQHFIVADGWRATHVGVGVFCLVTMIPLALMLRRRAPVEHVDLAGAGAAHGSLGLKPNTLQALLAIAGIACCVAMAMPQVHIVAYCSDLGYGVARGAEMLSLMLGLGLIARVASGSIADKIGGLGALMIGSTLQAFALLLYLGFNGLTSLYVVSALFGLFQGGIIPMYAVIVREYFPPKEAGVRVGIALMFALFGMALGGWMSGAIFDLTGSYRAAFANGFLWNLLNLAIVGWLIIRSRTWMSGRLAAA